MRVWPAMIVSLGACAGSGPRLAQEPYSGPPVMIESSGQRHTIVLRAPTTGWSLVLDRTNRLFDETEVYVSIRRPDPAFMHAQVVTTHRLDSSVESGVPVRLLARTQEFRARSRNQPYHKVEPARGLESDTPTK